MEVKSEDLLWLPSFRTPKCENCIFCGAGSSLRSGFAIKKVLEVPRVEGGRVTPVLWKQNRCEGGITPRCYAGAP